MPGHHWSDHINPDDPRWEHYNREENLEEEIAKQRDILKRMEDEILAIRMEEDGRIYNVEQQRIYRQANHRLNLATIALEDHLGEHGSYHSLRTRRPRPNLLSDEQIRMRRAAMEASQRGELAPGGSARRHSLRTSPVNTTPESPIRFATIGGRTPPPTIGGGGAFTTPPRSDSNRSSNQEPSDTRTSPIQTPNRPIGSRGGRGYVNRRRTFDPRSNRISPPNADDGESLVRSPSDGRQPGNRNTRSAEGRQRRPRTEQFKPTLKF